MLTLLRADPAPQLQKLSAAAPVAEDVRWAGKFGVYDDAVDKVSAKSSVKLVRCDTKVRRGAGAAPGAARGDMSSPSWARVLLLPQAFFHVSACSDPIIEELAGADEGNVFATETVLATLMAAHRSVFPWDVVITYLGGSLFFDMRNGEDFCRATVNETAHEPPSEDAGEEDPNSRMALKCARRGARARAWGRASGF